MARNDGVDRTCARNMDVTDNDIGDAQAHNEREKEIYSNEDIIPERSSLNVHFKEPTGSYAEMFEQMKGDNIISTRGLKADAVHFNEMVFDVNSAYFDNHGGYECQKIQSGALQQHHQLCWTAGLGIHGSGSHCTTSYKWVLRRFAVYVRTGGHSGGMAAGRVNPIAGMYVRSKRA